MSVRIRLRRIGKGVKGNPHYRVSVMNRTSPRDGRVKEELGFYNPIRKQLEINLERLDYWMKRGAQMSDTVASLTKKIRSGKGYK